MFNVLSSTNEIPVSSLVIEVEESDILKPRQIKPDNAITIVIRVSKFLILSLILYSNEPLEHLRFYILLYVLYFSLF